MWNKVIAFFVSLICGIALAGDSVSSAFTFDARYEKSGVPPEAWVAYQAEGVSDRFSAQTVVRAVDANENGIPDAWEQLYGLADEDALAAAGPDGDGRTNIQEYNAGTNPIVAEDYRASSSVSAAHTVDTWIESTAGGGISSVEVFGLSALFTANTAGRASDADKDEKRTWNRKLPPSASIPHGRGLRQHCIVRREEVKPPRPLRSDEKCGLNSNCFF